MKRPLPLAATLAAIPLLAVAVLSRSSGTIPGVRSVPIDAARAAPSCSVCHSGGHGGNGIGVSLTASAYSLDSGQSIQVTTKINGGGGQLLMRGGFAAECSAGAFAAGINTRIDSTARFVTHSQSAPTNNRTWTYGFTAPAAAGPVELWSVGLAADGDGGRSGDDWALSGSDGTASVGTPTRVYVNTQGVSGFGAGCAGSFGNQPVIGASQPPTIGNASFAVELIGAAASAPATFLVGARRATPLDLSLFGVIGCSLLVDSLADLSAATGPGSTVRGEGVASAAMPIPNDASLQNVRIDVQAAIIDPQNGRPLPLTLTGGLGITIR